MVSAWVEKNPYSWPLVIPGTMRSFLSCRHFLVAPRMYIAAKSAFMSCNGSPE